MLTTKFSIYYLAALLVLILVCTWCYAWSTPYSEREKHLINRVRRETLRYKRNGAMEKLSMDQNYNYSEEVPLSPRIVGGHPASYGDIPSQMYMTVLGSFKCGAVLLRIDGLFFALTAAHCVWLGSPKPDSIIAHWVIQVIGGDTNILYVSERDRFFNVTRIVMHELYDPRWDMNDLAILFLNQYVFEGMGLRHVGLPEHGWDEPEYVQISGWGSLIWQQQPSHDLQYVVIPTYPWEKCNLLKNSRRGHNISRANICVSPKGHGEYGPCHGDSGGPALGYNLTNDYWHLVGIASFLISDVCGDPRNAAGYVRVSYYMDWIKGVAIAYKAFHGTGNPFDNDTSIPYKK